MGCRVGVRKPHNISNRCRSKVNTWHGWFTEHAGEVWIKTIK